MSSLFGTSGIRGSAKEFLTNQVCFDIGRAFGIFLKKHKQKGKIALGMDSRKSGPRIKNAFSLGIHREGFEISDQGIAPVPAINYFLVANKTLTGSCMITGSHIRPDFNGFKFFAFKEEILKKHEREIEKIYEKIKEEVPFKAKKIKLERDKEAIGHYMNLLFKLANPPYPKMKIALDTGNGCQAIIMPKVLKKIGFSVKNINISLRPEKFIARDTETKEAAEPLKKFMKNKKFDIGIAFDGDGDRVIFVDGKRNFIPGDYTGSLIGKYSKSKILVTPINTSQVVDYLNKKVIRTKVGSPYVVEAMKRNGASFGFEANGGGISKEIMMSRDGGSTAIKILNLIKKTEKSLEELINSLPKFYLYRTKIDCPRELNQKIIKSAKKRFKGIKIEEIDGLKIWLGKTSWVLFRPSSNAPEFRVFAEAKTREKAEKIGGEGIAFVESFIN